MIIVLLGAPGSGKGTQAKLLADKFKIAHISTGDIFRENISNCTTLGKKAKLYIDKGKLVPDEITQDMLKKRLNLADCRNGFILDGFPRNISQAEFLEKFLNRHKKNIDAVVQVEVQDKEILKRLSSRRSCPGCGFIYNLINKKPKKAGICDICSTGLIKRSDDEKKVILKRLKVYKKETSPLIEFYKKRGLLLNIKGKGNPSEVFSKTLIALEKRP